MDVLVIFSSKRLKNSNSEHKEKRSRDLTIYEVA